MKINSKKFLPLFSKKYLKKFFNQIKPFRVGSSLIIVKIDFDELIFQFWDSSSIIEYLLLLVLFTKRKKYI